jgi:Flp pilus assembly protein TadG
MKRPPFLKRGERGQSLVEFSLVAVAFFILVLGIVDVGRAVWHYNALAQATREGTRYAIVHGANSTDPAGPGDTQAVTDQVEEFAGGLDLSELTVTPAWPDGDNQPGSHVEVTTSYNYTPLFGFFGVISIPMSSSSLMEITY